MNALFEFVDVNVAADTAAILADLDVAIPDDQLTVVAGASGSGKTSMLRLCNGLDVPTSGTVRFRGADLATLDPRAHRRKVGMVFQKPVLFPGTVRDNLLAADPSASDAEMAQTLTQVDIDPGFLDRVGDELSGGEAQRVCLARALMCHPEVLLMDEPTASLHPAAVRALETTAQKLHRSQGVGVVWVTHDLDQISRLAEHLVILDHGGLAYAGAPGTDDAEQAIGTLGGEES